ncbi:hypothetical protein CR513_56031, partial [Mucuna pruriens]
VKYNANGSLERYKTRLVVKGYTQIYGADYQETFALVAKMNATKILLALAAHFNWKLRQYDVKNTFFHGDLNEETYMNISLEFEGDRGSKVCKLQKVLHGLKQFPRAWFERFTKAMKEFGYKQSQGDYTLFIKHIATGGVTALLVYVDNIIIIGNDEKEKGDLKRDRHNGEIIFRNVEPVLVMWVMYNTDYSEACALSKVLSAMGFCLSGHGLLPKVQLFCIKKGREKSMHALRMLFSGIMAAI